MFAQALIEHFLFHRITLAVGEHPVSKLRVPAEAVTAHLDAILSAEIGYLVCSFPVPHTFFWVYFSWFHVILCGDAVELFNDERLLALVANITLVQCNTDGEIVFVGVFQPLCVCGQTAHGEQQPQNRLMMLFHILFVDNSSMQIYKK